MENFDFNPAKEAKDVKGIEDAVKKIAALQRQINNPTRDGMINALSDAQSTAGKKFSNSNIPREIQSQRRGCVFRIKTCIGN